MAIDTLGYSDYLEEHGVPRDQAKAHAAAANQFLFPQLATQADLRLLGAELRGEMSSLKVEISSAKNWVIMAMVGIAGLALTISRML
jgi:hypothetical protein